MDLAKALEHHSEGHLTEVSAGALARRLHEMGWSWEQPMIPENLSPEADAYSELFEWWMTTSRHEISNMTTKITEYGGLGRATDLVEMGRMMASLAGRRVDDDGESQEIGCAIYVYGKMGRVMAAIREGRLPSDDTWHDIGVYARMVQRIRAHGGWPV